MSSEAANTVVVWTMGEKIVKCIDRSGLGRVGFAAALGVSTSLVSKWTRDTRTPRVAQLWKIEELGRVPAGFLTTRMEGEPPVTGPLTVGYAAQAA